MENQKVEQVVEVTEVQEVKEQFPSDSMLESMGISREEFDQKVEENKQLTPDQQNEKLDKMIEENMKLQEELTGLNKQMERTNLITSLNKEGLNEFQGLFDLETVEEKVAFLKEVKNQILVSHSYQPKEVAKQEQYTQAIENGDVEKALGFKFSKLFGK
ncbi:MAG TPA: hypothetical protein VNR61_19140 [Niallia sp.]|nr:hypothetical protein [Niallia sp.]